MGLPPSHGISRAPWYSLTDGSLTMPTTGLLPPLARVSTPFVYCELRVSLPQGISTSLLGSYLFARHYSGNRWFTFSSSGYLDGSVPRVPLHKLLIHLCIPIVSYECVPAFGYPWLNVYLRLPTAFRSLSRPSSAPDALGILHTLFIA